MNKLITFVVIKTGKSVLALVFAYFYHYEYSLRSGKNGLA